MTQKSPFLWWVLRYFARMRGFWSYPALLIRAALGWPWAAVRFLRAAAYAEHDRWPLWLPVALGTGVGCYFALPLEPAGWCGVVAVLLAVVAVWWGRSGRFGFLLVAALCLGFAAAILRTHMVAAPVLGASFGPLRVIARVVAAEPRGDGMRLLLAPEPIRRLHYRTSDNQTPARIRVSVRYSQDLPAPGSFVRLTAMLMPPPGPAMPGDYDFARWAYYRRIGATGYSYGRPHPVPPPRALTLWESTSAGLERLRDRMTARITAAVPGDAGAIAAALITGERAGVLPETEEAYRNSGLTHVLSISGVHLALAGGIFFWVIRALLALLPTVALCYPIKKWAAVAALAGSAFYLAISGADPPAVRSEIMLATMFCAILFDRPALSMRSVALAATIVLLIEPESLADPGCQMSFASVVGLIALAEWLAARRRHHPTETIWPLKLLRYAGGIVAVSLIAGLVSAPIAIFHFNRASQYGLISNLLAEPVVGFIIMPAATAAMVAMPFGLEAAPLWLMGKGVGVMSAIAFWVAAMPGAGSLAPVWPLVSLIAVMGGFLWCALWLKRWRWFGLIAIAGGICWSLTVRPPDLLVAQNFGAVAVRGRQGTLIFLQKPKDRYAAADWLRREADPRDVPDAVSDSRGVRCDDLGCLATTYDGRVMAFDTRVDALAEDCAHARIVVSMVPAHWLCSAPLVIDRFDVLDGGGYAVWFTPQIRMVSVAARRGVRPWSMPWHR